MDSPRHPSAAPRPRVSDQRNEEDIHMQRTYGIGRGGVRRGRARRDGGLVVRSSSRTIATGGAPWNRKRWDRTQVRTRSTALGLSEALS